jgi:hypothetical protein
MKVGLDHNLGLMLAVVEAASSPLLGVDRAENGAPKRADGVVAVARHAT